MSSIQMDFTLRTSTNVKTVHLLGSWDNYQGQLPLSKDSRKKGGWKGTFKFQGATLVPGHRYWYYYIIDGYHVSHDPAKDSTIEPTTGRQLNILDVPASTVSKPASSRHSKRQSRPSSIDIPKGRGVSPSKIRSPHPVKPNQTRHIVQADYNTLEHLSQQFSHATLESSEEESSDEDSDVPSLTSSRSSASSSPSSLSSSSSCCTCERYGITRSGERVKLDCGGARCGSSDGGSSCSSDSEDDYRRGTTRRNGMVVYD